MMRPRGRTVAMEEKTRPPSETEKGTEMLHYETRTDSWYLNGHAVDPYEDFAAILRARDEETTEDQPELGTGTERVVDPADDELHRAIVREAMTRVWSPESVDRVIRACLLSPAGH